MARMRWIGVGALLSLPAAQAQAAPCDCDHVLELDQQIVDAGALGVAAGDTVCVRGGPRPFLRLQNFKGEQGKTIEIRNCEGQVDIDNDDKGYGLTIDRSNFVHLTGTGDRAFEYGFKVRAARTGPEYSASSVAIGDLSSDIEVDHVEAYDSGFAGFIVKTDPRCDGSANLGKFVMYNSALHHLYIHDTHGEGIYFGSTGYGGREYTCDGQKVLLYPHEHHGAQLHDILIENTGWDGAQIGVTPKDCAFYRNVIKNVGLAGELYQQQGLQIGGASTCSVWGNVLMDGPTNGLFILGTDDTDIYNNLIVNFKGSAIYINDQKQPLDARNRVAFNTMVQSGGKGLTVFGASLGPGYAYSNVAVGAGAAAFGIGNDVKDFPQLANVSADSPDGLGFVDPAARDFHLLETSMLRDVGVPAPDLAIADDLDGAPRSDGTPDVGAFEFNLEADTTGGETTSAETGADTVSTTGPETTSDATGGPSTATGGPSTATSGDAPTGGETTDSADPTGPAANTTSVDPTETSSASATDTGGEQSDSGCGCNSPGTSAPVALTLLVLLRRRRRDQPD
ncbi:MAG: right-handed parallel beta-helix repeat-containing protein [Nannocystis sp.]|nr:right-handed parallel beta-helix repeat-containing protein [Nannocystis sp.]MBA3545017.1 right-handed parallel beta-helix repeat-containing protein [Nannocystis sp.]